jgi:hypothetical protein
MDAAGGVPWTRGLGSWNDGSRLSRPHGLACIGDHVYICDTENHFVRRTDSTFLDTLENVAGIGRSVWGRSEGAALKTTLSDPVAVFPGPNGALYVTSSLESTLMEVRRGKVMIKAGMSGGAFKDGHVSVATLEDPSGGCVDPDTGVIYVVDGENCRIRKISRLDVVSTIGTGDIATRDGVLTKCAFNMPVAICLGKEDTFYISEYSAIRLLDARKGLVKTLSGQAGVGFQDGATQIAKFLGLKEIAFRNQTLFICDNGNDRIRKVDLVKGKVSTLLGPLSTSPPLPTPILRRTTPHPRTDSENGSKSTSITHSTPSNPTVSRQHPTTATVIRSFPHEEKKPRSAPFGLCLTSRGDLVFSQPKLNQLGVIRDVTPPLLKSKYFKPYSSSTHVSSAYSALDSDSCDPLEPDFKPEHLSVSLTELKSFEISGAGSSSTGLPSLHPAVIDLIYPSLANPTYFNRLLETLSSAEIPVDEMFHFLYSEELPSSWDGVKILNAFVICKKVHLPPITLEVLLSHLHAYLYVCEYENLFVLLNHVETHCKRNKELASMISSFVVLHRRINSRLDEQEKKELPQELSVWALENIGAEKAKPPGLFRVERLAHDSHIRSRCQLLHAHYIEGAMKSNLSSPSSASTSSSSSASSLKKNKHRGSSIPKTIEEFPAASSLQTDNIFASPSLSPNFTLISCDGHSSFQCHDWLLFARWPFFRHLIMSGSIEWTRDKALRFPPDTYHAATIQAFLLYLYTNNSNAFCADEAIANELLRHAQQFNILTLENPPRASPGLETLVAACKTTFNRLCTPENCIDKYKLVNDFGSEIHKFRVAAFIAANLPLLLQNETLAPQLLSLGAATLGNIWVWVNGGPPMVESSRTDIGVLIDDR